MVLVRGSDNLDRDILEGITAYNNKDYQKASIDLQSVLNKDPENYMVALYLAVSQIEIKEFESSINNLAIAQTNPLLKDQANWYTALVHLINDEINLAKKYFSNIAADPDHYKRVDAKVLLEDLE